MAAFPAGTTIEQRYPGASEVDARGLAARQLAAFVAAGWIVTRETWAPASVAEPPTGAPPRLGGSNAGTLVVTLRAERDADLPVPMPGRGSSTWSDPRPWTPWTGPSAWSC